MPARCHDRQERWYLPELLRIKGELRLRESPQSEAAEACFHEAMGLAAQQGADSASCGVRSALRGSGSDEAGSEARAVLEKACDAMTEGSGIADTRLARDLIAHLHA